MRAFGAYGGSVGLKKIAGATLIVGGLLVGVFGSWTLGLAMVGQGIGLLTQPNAPGGDLEALQGAVLENRTGAHQPVVIVYGETMLGGIVVDERVDPASEDRKRLVIVLAICHGSSDGSGIEGFDEVWFDDRLAINGAGTIQIPFNTIVEDSVPAFRHLEYSMEFGTDAQLVDSHLNTVFPAEWPETSRGRGVAYLVLDLWYNTDIYIGGVPTVRVKVKGSKVYDPREDVWAFSSNPALCIRDYLISPYGMNLSEDDLDEDSFIAAANYCDEVVDGPSGYSAPRFTCNGWLDTSRDVNQNLAQLCTSCRGQVINEGGKWRMLIRRERAVTNFEITEHNTVEGSWQFILPGSNSVPNIGRATFVDPAQKYSADEVAWPDPEADNIFLEEDSGYERAMSIDLPFTNNRIGAQQILMTAVKEARFALGATVTLKEEAFQIRTGDLVYVTHPTPGWNQKVFDVLALLLQPDGNVQAILGEYQGVTYDIDPQNVPPQPIETDLPNRVSNAIPEDIVDEQGDLIVAIGPDQVAVMPKGYPGQVLVVDPDDSLFGLSWQDLDAIPESLIDAKGDLVVGLADNEAGRLGVGADGNILQAASGETAGVKWIRGIADAATALTDGSTITWNLAGRFESLAVVTLGGDRTLDITNVVAGCRGTLIVKQDGTGSRTLTLPSGSKVRDEGAGEVPLSTDASAVDVLAFVYDGTNFFWTYGSMFT
jgi:hypothetical protein